MEENQEKKINTDKAIADIRAAFTEIDIDRAAKALAVETYLFKKWLENHPKKRRKGL